MKLLRTDKSSLERKSILASAAANAVLGALGLVFSYFASSQAILLDGVFNLTYFATGLFTFRVAELLQQSDDEYFPFGYAQFEPLVNGIKGLLVLGVTTMALIGAISALFSGGSSINAGPATIYGAIASIVCWALAFMMLRLSKKTESPLIQADGENWIVNAAISSAVLLAFIVVFFIQDTSVSYLTPYVDPTLVLIVVAVSIGVPIRMAWQSLKELLGHAPSSRIVRETREVISESLKELPAQSIKVRIIQPGRSRIVLVHVILPEDHDTGTLSYFDKLRRNALVKLLGLHSETTLEMVFTLDPEIGAFQRPS